MQEHDRDTLLAHAQTSLLYIQMTPAAFPFGTRPGKARNEPKNAYDERNSKYEAEKALRSVK